MRLFGEQFLTGVLRDPVSAIVGIGGSIVNGIVGHNAAKSAAQLQAEAAQKAGTSVVNKAEGESQYITGAGVNAATGVNNATTDANKLLDPYTSAGAEASGTLQQGLKTGGDFNKTPTLADLQIDPGYAFRLQQGQMAMDRSAAARGGALSGGAIKTAQDYAQGSASQEYQNAFNRFETSTQNRVANLTGVANRGATADTTQGGNLMNAAVYGGNANMNQTNLAEGYKIDANKTAADYLTQGANAQAAGKVAGANAITGAIGGGVGAVTGAIQLKQQNQQNAALIAALSNPASSAARYI